MDTVDSTGVGGTSGLVRAPSSPLGSLPHHLTPVTGAQQPSHNGRKPEKPIIQGDQTVLDKSTESLDEASLANELDMFDIELQKEFQAASLRSVVMPVRPHPANHGGVKVFPRATVGSVNYPTPATAATLASNPLRGARGSMEVGPLPTTSVASDPGKRFSSVADAYQLSMFTQDQEKSVHLIHILAQDIRREMQITGGSTASNITGQSASWAAKSSPGLATSPSTTSFVDDLRLVTTVVHDIQQNCNLNFGVPSSPGGATGLGAGAGGTGLSSHAAGMRGVFPRTSPRGGRSTIDTEVNDSLRRLNYATNSPGHYHDYEARPANPHGAQLGPTHGLAGATSHFSNPSGPTYESIPDNASSTPTVVHYLEHVTLTGPGPTTPAAGGKKCLAGSGSGAQAVAYPLAVKPQPGVAAVGRGGRNRGPRSRSGKNVAPSNHSAFSECSGGETRSRKSATPGFLNAHANSFSSMAGTTNTSVSSTTLPYPTNAALHTGAVLGVPGEVESATKGLGAGGAALGSITGTKCE